MTNLNKIKETAKNSNQTEALLVLDLVSLLQDEEDANDDLISASLDELIEWAQAFRDALSEEEDSE